MGKRNGDFHLFVDAVRRGNDLREIIGRDVALKPAGDMLRGLSPFRAGQAASLVVNAHAQTWRDVADTQWRGGDVFTYIQERDGLSFHEALRLLAERIGFRLTKTDESIWKRDIARATKRRQLEDLWGRATTYYHQRLPADVREQYLVNGYGFTDETINNGMLGWADGGLFKHFAEAGISRKDALATGLFVLFDTGSIVDGFNGRLVFPYWRDGRVVYLTSRATHRTPNEPWEDAKYKKLRVASDAVPYISELVTNDYLFNEDAIRDATELVITEGVPDCLSAKQCGVACVSPGTTRLRAQDVTRLAELARDVRRVIICNDAEVSGAGEMAAVFTAEQLWLQGLDVCIAQIPRPREVEKRDLNDLVKAEGSDGLQALLASAQPLPDYLLSRVPVDGPADEVAGQLDPLLVILAHRVWPRTEAVLEAITQRYPVQMESLRDRMRQLAPSADPRVVGPAPAGGALPVIEVTARPLRELVEAAWQALFHANTPPRTFQRAGRVVQLEPREHGEEVFTLPEPSVNVLASQVADWMHISQAGPKHVFPPRDVVRSMWSRPHAKLPVLDMVVDAPFFDATGELITSPGYHPNARTWLRPSGLLIAEVPRVPAAADVAAARTLLLDELLHDFPLATASDQAHAVATLLLPFVRRMIPDCTPIHLFEASSPGAGKGLLADLVYLLALGTPATPTTLTQDEDETKKKITALLLRAPPVILLDNIKDTLDSAQLAAAITSSTWTDRVLGEARIADLPNQAVWIATANNVGLSLEIARRCVRVRLKPNVDRPWLRSGFRHDPLKPWVLEHRRELVHALFVLVQAWLTAGRPPAPRTLGSFQGWSHVIGGILTNAGIPGFLADVDEMYDQVDNDTVEWKAMITAWWNRYKSLRVHVGELLDLAQAHNLLSHVIGDGFNTQSMKIRLGKALARLRDRHFDNLQLVIDRDHTTKSALYRLVDTTALQVPPAQNSLDELLSFVSQS